MATECEWKYSSWSLQILRNTSCSQKYWLPLSYNCFWLILIFWNILKIIFHFPQICFSSFFSSKTCVLFEKTTFIVKLLIPIYDLLYEEFYTILESTFLKETVTQTQQTLFMISSFVLSAKTFDWCLYDSGSF